MSESLFKKRSKKLNVRSAIDDDETEAMEVDAPQVSSGRSKKKKKDSKDKKQNLLSFEDELEGEIVGSFTDILSSL